LIIRGAALERDGEQPPECRRDARQRRSLDAEDARFMIEIREIESAIANRRRERFFAPRAVSHTSSRFYEILLNGE